MRGLAATRDHNSFLIAHRSSCIMTEIETEIEIFLSIDEVQTTSFLSIPRSDIERLAVSPFRWIRYVMFAICGARGDLRTTVSQLFQVLVPL
jgi:hypothetical protein